MSSMSCESFLKPKPFGMNTAENHLFLIFLPVLIWIENRRVKTCPVTWNDTNSRKVNSNSSCYCKAKKENKLYHGSMNHAIIGHNLLFFIPNKNSCFLLQTSLLLNNPSDPFSSFLSLLTSLK